MNEFELIRRYFHFPQGPGVVVGPGDDGAVLAAPANRQLVMVQDTSLTDRHFPADAPADAIGYRCLAVNLSDLAAMGAQPLWFLLSLTLPETNEAWLDGFSRGLFQAAREAGISLVGGDTTRGPLSVSITATGSVTPDLALRRDGARPGDRIAIGGTPGLAGLGLAQWQAGDHQGDAVPALLRPRAQLTLGRQLVGQVSACIDVSDGLLADLAHILAASGGLGACLQRDSLPTGGPLQRLPRDERLALQLQAGDDYLLLFTLPPDEPMPEGCHAIGEVRSAAGLYLQDSSGAEQALDAQGWRHF